MAFQSLAQTGFRTLRDESSAIDLHALDGSLYMMQTVRDAVPKPLKEQVLNDCLDHARLEAGRFECVGVFGRH